MSWPLVPCHHDHSRTMLFTLTTARCTGCGAQWVRENDGQWECISPGRAA